MSIFYICLLVFLILVLLFFIFLRIIFNITFAPMRKISSNYKRLPRSAQYKSVENKMLALIEKLEGLEFEQVNIKSYDNLNLYGKYYKANNEKVIQLCFHGYRGSAMRDFCGGSQIARSIGTGHILVDVRCHGKSEGKAITFGIKERYDVTAWVDYTVKRFGEDVKIILSGVSMGAATVLMASSMDLPKNVIGIIADCPYSSPKEIIKKVADDKQLSGYYFYPFIKLSARIFAHVNLDETTPVKALQKTNIPILIIHGDNDKFVPYSMGKKCFYACSSKHKEFVTIEKAGHAISYLVDEKKYTDSVTNFINSMSKKMTV